MTSSQPSPTNLSDELDKILADYDVGEAICVKCRHDIYLHYWNGAGNPENSGWDSCKADGCECIGEEIEFEPNTPYECPLKTEFVPSQGAKAALQAYYTHECARKVLEGRIDTAQTALRACPTQDDKLRKWLEQHIVSIRAAIEEVGDEK